MEDSSNVVQEEKIKRQIFPSDSIGNEESSAGRILVILFLIIIGVGVFVAGIVCWAMASDTPAALESINPLDQRGKNNPIGKQSASVPAINTKDERDKNPVDEQHASVPATSLADEPKKDPLGGQGASIPVGSDMLHVTSIALGTPQLIIVNGKRLATGDWLVLKTPNGDASVRVDAIGDGFVRFSHGDDVIDAPLEVIKVFRPPSAQPANSPKHG